MYTYKGINHETILNIHQHASSS